MHIEGLVRAVNRVENPPIPDRVLGQTGQVRCNGLVAEIPDLGRQHDLDGVIA